MGWCTRRFQNPGIAKRRGGADPCQYFGEYDKVVNVIMALKKIHRFSLPTSPTQKKGVTTFPIFPFLEITWQNWQFKIGLSLFDFKQLLLDNGDIVQCRGRHSASEYGSRWHKFVCFQADFSIILKGFVRLGWDTQCFNRAVRAQFRFQADS